MKIIFQGHALTALEATCQVRFNYQRLRLIDAIRNVASSVEGPAFPKAHHRRDAPFSPCPCFPTLKDGTERSRYRAATRSIFWTGCVLYKEKVLGLCKSTCFTFFLPKLPGTLRYNRDSDKGRWRSSPNPEHLLSRSAELSPASVPDNAKHFFALCLLDMCNIRWNVPKPANTLESRKKKFFWTMIFQF